MREPEKTEFPEEFVEYAKQKLATSEEYVRHRAKFGNPVLKGIAQMILAAAGENREEQPQA